MKFVMDLCTHGAQQLPGTETRSLLDRSEQYESLKASHTDELFEVLCVIKLTDLSIFKGLTTLVHLLYSLSKL